MDILAPVAHTVKFYGKCTCIIAQFISSARPFILDPFSFLPRMSCIPISDVSKQQCPDQDSQHKARLCKLGKPFLLTHQVPFCDNTLLHLAMIKLIAITWLHRFIASKLILKALGVVTQHFATGSKFPLFSVNCPYHHWPISRSIKRPDLLQRACWVVSVQDISDVQRSIAKKLWGLHQENRGQVVNPTWCGLENSTEVEVGLKPREWRSNVSMLYLTVINLQQKMQLTAGHKNVLLYNVQRQVLQTCQRNLKIGVKTLLLDALVHQGKKKRF